MSRRRKRSKPRHENRPAPKLNDNPDVRPDWSQKCSVCGASPIMPLTGLCGPCTFGESDTIDGNW